MIYFIGLLHCIAQAMFERFGPRLVEGHLDRFELTLSIIRTMVRRSRQREGLSHQIGFSYFMREFHSKDTKLLFQSHWKRLSMLQRIANVESPSIEVH